MAQPLHARPDQDCRYDAFLSYRHLPLDHAVAQRLQTLLENYRPPQNLPGLRHKRIRRIFRDQSELPTSSDLGADIQEALLSSRYLIVICSEALKESVWCMEEIRLFKAAHGGRTDRILTLLVSGEPRDVFPETLTQQVEPGPDGRTGLIRHIEPLSGDVRATSRAKSLRLLKTEFLRIAAPLLGCGYDDLFQRHLRRRRRRLTAGFGGSFALLAAILCVVSVFAYRTWVSEGNYRRALTATYLQKAADLAVSDDPQGALSYCTEALALDPDNATAAAGAATLLQNYSWPVLDAVEDGMLNGTSVVHDTTATVNARGDRWLEGTGYTAPYLVTDSQGQTVSTLPPGCQLIDGKGRDLWAFSQGDGLLLYDTGSDTTYSLSLREAYSRGFDGDADALNLYSPSVLDLGQDRAAVAYGGMVRLYELKDGEAKLLAQADLADALPEEEATASIFAFNDLYASRDGSLLIATNHSCVVVYDGGSLALLAVIPEYVDTLIGAAFSADNRYLALHYGNLYPTDYANPVSFVAVYDAAGTRLFVSPEKTDETILGAQFHPEQPNLLLVWGRGFLRIWDWQQGVEISAPLYVDHMDGAAFLDETTLGVDGGAGQVYRYRLLGLPDQQTDQAPTQLPETPVGYDTLSLEGGIRILRDWNTLTLVDQEDQVLDQLELEGIAPDRMSYDAERGWLYLYNRTMGTLARLAVDCATGTLSPPEPWDTGGNQIMALWFGSHYTLAQTAESHLLVYDAQGELLRTIISPQGGSLQGVVTDQTGRYLAVVLKPIAHQAGEYRFIESGLIELWNIAEGTLIATFQNPDQKISGVAFTDQGALVWSDGTRVEARQIVLPTPDGHALAGLRQLACLALQPDGSQVCQTPALEGNLGSWQQLLGTWEDALAPQSGETAGLSDSDSPADDDALNHLLDQLSAREDPGSDDWYGEADQIWGQIADGTLSPSVGQLDRLFSLYIGQDTAADPGRLAPGVEVYCDWYGGQDWALGGESVQSLFDSLALEVLDLTQEYDSTFGATLRTIGSGGLSQESLVYLDQLEQGLAELEEQAATADEEALEELQSDYLDQELLLLDARYQYVSALMVTAYADLLEGGGPEALEPALHAALEDQDLFSLAATHMPLYELLAGRAQEAAEYTDTMMEYEIAMGLEETDRFLTMQSLARWVSVLTERGAISLQDQQQWLEQSQYTLGLQTSDLSTQAQSDGIQPGDLVVCIDGTWLLSSGQYRRLTAGEVTSVSVLRNRMPLEIFISPESGFGYRWVLVDKAAR